MLRVVFSCLIIIIAFNSFSQDSSIPERNKVIEDSLNAISDSILNHRNAVVPDETPAVIATPDSVKDDFKADSSPAAVSNQHPAQANMLSVEPGLTWEADTTFRKFLSFHGIADKSFIQKMPGDKRIIENNDIKFYVLLFLLFFLGIIKTAFPKYFSSLFSLSFQSSFRQLQTREQLMQISFPAFMLNLLFVISAGFLIALSVQSNNKFNLPEIVSVSCLTVGVVYAVKYAVISFCGWLFSVQKPAVEYRFIVFYINKILGIIFLPLLLVLAFDDESNRNIILTIALSIAAIALCARYIISLSRIRGVLHINAFHFFIYFCCIEIMPLLVIYKTILIYSGKAFLIKG